MKKLVYTRFGGLDALALAEAPLPQVGRNQVLVQVRAAAINPVDWKFREGQLKVMTGWRMPQGLGLEFAGIVTAVGSAVTDHRVGDEVYGAGKDCIAEFVAVDTTKIAIKPAGISFEAASTIPVAGVTAQSAFDRVPIAKGTQVLVNGATGGIGQFVTQLALRRGAEVTAVVSEKGAELVRRWGVHHVVVANARRNPAGLFRNLYASQRYALMGQAASTALLRPLAEQAASRELEIVVGRTFPLSEFYEAYRATAAGEVLGKAVFTMDVS